jgi:phosphodiesterase/alkaline phosphatase D-like protein
MLRDVGPSSATVWVETDAPCIVEVLGHQARTFTVAGHHYALVIVEGLEPGSCTEYEVHVDGERRWPSDASEFPPSSIRTVDAGPVRVLFGSCRTAAPHEPPWTLEMTLDPTGRGVDALRAHAQRMLGQAAEEWPHIAVMIGDQVYADDSSPVTRERIAVRRDNHPVEGLPAELVAGFEEYCWLYPESWSPDIARWFFSVVPTAMIFDDHEMIDDWNISDSWVRVIRQEPWWNDHVIGGLVS